jgi:Uma2 family endonuclease
MTTVSHSPSESDLRRYNNPVPASPAEFENGDTMTQEEFHRLYEQTPETFKAELVGGVVYISSPVYFHDDQGNELSLDNGDNLTQEEFHNIYQHAPPGLKAELVGGIVYMASPLKVTHGSNHLPLGSLFFIYEAKTRGVEAGDNTTIKLARDLEPQPDLYLRVLPACGGRTRTVHDYVVGAPECLAEVAVRSRSFDLNQKRVEYQRHGVEEYLVVVAAERRLRWFDLAAGREHDIPADGIIRLATFPGLWIDVAAVFAKDSDQMLKVMEAGLATPEHAEFVLRLEMARQRSGGG